MNRLLAACLLVSPLCLAGCPASPPATPAASPPATPADDPSSPAFAPVPAGLEAFEPLLGLSPAAARQWLQEHPTAGPEFPDTPVIEVRAVRIDGEPMDVTMDLRADRLNVIVDQGQITALESIG